MKVADRIASLQPYLFARIEQQIADARAAGIDVISLGIGDPDLGTPSAIVDELARQAAVPENHRYPTTDGLLAFRSSVAAYYRRRFNVELDAHEEVVSLIGSKEGIAHISFCYIDPGDLGLVTDPGYPVYQGGIHFAGGETYYIPITAGNNFLPDLQAVPAEVARRAKLMFINYPNNPTGATADLEFFNRVVAFARAYDILVCHDAAYVDIAFDGYRPPSFLQAPGAKEVGIEFGSVSKPYSMTGWRIGWAAGNASVIKTLSKFKSNLDSGVFQPVQYAAIKALDTQDDAVSKACAIYRARRDRVMATLGRLGWNLAPPPASLYIWAPVPRGFDSLGFAEEVFKQASVVITPGVGYGPQGEGYFRISLTTPDDQLDEALRRLEQSPIRFKE